MAIVDNENDNDKSETSSYSSFKNNNNELPKAPNKYVEEKLPSNLQIFRILKLFRHYTEVLLKTLSNIYETAVLRKWIKLFSSKYEISTVFI